MSEPTSLSGLLGMGQPPSQPLDHPPAKAALVALCSIPAPDPVPRLVVGARMEANFLRRNRYFRSMTTRSLCSPSAGSLHHPANLLLGLPFSLTLIFIFFRARDGALALFTPAIIASMQPRLLRAPHPAGVWNTGHFLPRCEFPIPPRAALFNIGITRPIAGFIPACLALVVGVVTCRIES